MKKRTPVPAYTLLLSLNNKLILFCSHSESLCISAPIKATEIVLCLYGKIGEIFLFVFNTKRTLSDTQLPSYQQNSLVPQFLEMLFIDRNKIHNLHQKLLCKGFWLFRRRQFDVGTTQAKKFATIPQHYLTLYLEVGKVTFSYEI